MDPSCQPREAKKENDVAVLYACLGVFVAVFIVVAILLYLKWKSKSRKGMYCICDMFYGETLTTKAA